MIGSEWRNARGTVIQIVVEEPDPMEGWTYRFVKVAGWPSVSEKTKTISDQALRSLYRCVTPSVSAEDIARDVIARIERVRPPRLRGDLAFDIARELENYGTNAPPPERIEEP